jgi:hypothetical protein
VLASGELAPDTATLLYLSELGAPVTVEPLQATCTRFGESLGLFGSSGGPLVGRYQLSIAPFRGNGVYRTDAQRGEVAGSVSIAGLLQLFVGPPFETTAEVARDGALGRVRFSGTGVDGRPAAGIIRWECSEVRPAPGAAPSSG